MLQRKEFTISRGFHPRLYAVSPSGLEKTNDNLFSTITRFFLNLTPIDPDMGRRIF